MKPFSLLGLSVRLHLTLTVWLAGLIAGSLARREGRRDERGDVPGWVLVTVMSAGLVMVIWAVAREELSSMVRSALRSVRA